MAIRFQKRLRPFEPIECVIDELDLANGGGTTWTCSTASRAFKEE